MKITCTDIGKKYQGQWIFSNITFDFIENSKTAITGFNGSGKSTLLSILSGYTTPTKGTINHYVKSKEIVKDELFNYLAIGSPYIEVPEELSPANVGVEVVPMLCGRDSVIAPDAAEVPPFTST